MLSALAVSPARLSIAGTCRFIRMPAHARATVAQCSALGEARLSITPPSDEDKETIRRQVGHVAPDNICGVGLRCKHGFPQAFAFDPTGRNSIRYQKSTQRRRSKLESGMFRLSCPLLVKAVDEWEAEGAVRLINEEVVASAELSSSSSSSDAAAERGGDTDASATVARNQMRHAYSRVELGLDLSRLLEEAHADHAAARHELLGERLPELLVAAAEESPEQREIVEHVLGSGVAGQTRSKPDIKCVHAQLADGICRSKSNGVANELLRRLEARGTAVDGDDVCCNQCDAAVPEATARDKWWYEPSKNKWKLRKRNAMRKARKSAAVSG